DPVAITQLNKEFNIMFPLDSPNVVRVLTLTSIGKNIPAIEMEWCEGSDIRALMETEINPDQVIEIIRGVFNGLKDIHRAAIIHRDIKPENVMYDPFRRVVKIIDFGCAYLTGGVTLQGPNGTIGYTPEEKMMVGSEPEPKDDLYALGVMIAEMADCDGIHTKGKSSVCKKLKRFSDKLLDGEYDDAESAESAFERMFLKRKNLALLLRTSIVVILVTLVAAFFIIKSNLPKSQPQQEISSTEIKSDSVHPDTHPPLAENQEALPINTDITGHEKSPQITTENIVEDRVIPMPKQSERWLNPYSDVSADDEATYELAIAAGRLLDLAGSQNSSPKVKMDAFVIKFCDSIYHAENLSSKYPRHIDTDKSYKLAAQLANKYKNQLETEFNRHFPNLGDRHRREILLEGRFYCSLKTYHYNPYSNSASFKKSN
ncbi:MAG: protein kinase, partial [Muribaculaceae bacterium]|nr:protein kinase [Muribaculaceae bacterium]